MRTFVLALSLIALVGAAPPGAGASGTVEWIEVAGGAFQAGDAAGEPDEAPRPASVNSFRIMRHEVTNRQFRAFVDQTGYVTDAERSGAAFVWTDRWRLVDGADWRRPNGPDDDFRPGDDHPVVQVSARDAQAFCAAYGFRLPTDDEWEFAARGADGRTYPWGNAPPEGNGKRLANFGTIKCCAADEADGFAQTAPVGAFPAGASPVGALDMAGNVWEWTASRFPGQPQKVTLRGGGWGNNPYCLRTSYRHGNPPEYALNMVGFRCAADP